MNKKLLLLIIIMLFIVQNMVFALRSDDELYDLLLVQVRGEEPGNIIKDSSSYDAVGTIYGTPVHNTDHCVVGDCWNNSGAVDSGNNYFQFNLTAEMATVINSTFIIWACPATSVSQQNFCGRNDDKSDGEWNFQLSTTSMYGQIWLSAAAGNAQSTAVAYDNTCHMFTVVINQSGSTIVITTSVNKTTAASASKSLSIASLTVPLTIGVAEVELVSDRDFKNIFDEGGFYNDSLSDDERDRIFDLNDAGLPLEPSAPPAPPVQQFSITSVDFDNGSIVNNFTAIISNATETYINFTTTGNITFENISNGLFDIIVLSDMGGGYYTFNKSDHNAAADLEVNLVKYYRVFNTTYSGFVEFNNSNFTRSLKYNISYRCPDFSNTTLDTYTNGTITQQNNLTCTNSTALFNASISYSEEGNFTLWHFLNTTFLPDIHNELFGNSSFISDLINPSVSINFTVPEGFAVPLTNTTLICSDNIFVGNLTYNITFNQITLTYANFSNGTTLKNETDLIDGPNFLTGGCADPFGKTMRTINRTIFNAELILIDEVDNTDFDLDNVTGARAYFDENQTFFDFKVSGTNRANFSASVTNKLRIELIYLDGTVITRYIDMNLLPNEVRVCANKEGITHFQQLIISARERSTILENVFADCVVAADTTRFAFQDSFVLQAFTISSLYSLITVREGREIILASLDGSLETFINLDALELSETPFNLKIQPETISFEKTGATTIQIHYLNIQLDNTELTLDITNMDTDTSVFRSSSFADLNDVTIFFDYSTLSNVSNTTLFFIQADSIKPTTTNSFKRYFNTNASSGLMRSEFAFLISFLLVIFGLTFTATRLALGWFGIFMLIFAIATLSFSVLTTAVIFLMAVETILLVFIFVILTINTYPTLN